MIPHAGTSQSRLYTANFRGNKINNYALKSCIFVEIDDLWITGRSFGNLPPNFFHAAFISQSVSYTYYCLVLTIYQKGLLRVSKECNGSRVTERWFALVGSIVRFTFLAQIIVAGQIMSSFLNRQNSNVPRIDP